MAPQKKVATNQGSGSKRMKVTSAKKRAGHSQGAGAGVRGKSQLFVDSVLSKVSPSLVATLSGQQSTHQKMSLMDLSKLASSILVSKYKVHDEEILNTTVQAMSGEDSSVSEDIQSSVESLAPYKQLLMEKNTNNLLRPGVVELLFANAGGLDAPANAALQAQLLASAISLTGSQPSGVHLKISSSKSSGLTKPEIKKRLNLIVTISEVLFQRSMSLKNFPKDNFAKLHKDLLNIVF